MASGDLTGYVYFPQGVANPTTPMTLFSLPIPKEGLEFRAFSFLYLVPKPGDWAFFDPAQVPDMTPFGGAYDGDVPGLIGVGRQMVEYAPKAILAIPVAYYNTGNLVNNLGSWPGFAIVNPSV